MLTDEQKSRAIYELKLRKNSYEAEELFFEVTQEDEAKRIKAIAEIDGAIAFLEKQ